LKAAPHPQWVVPDWPAPTGVRALITTRAGGVSTGPFGAGADGGGMNIGLLSGDSLADVQANRRRLRALLPDEPRWLRQVHGAEVACLDHIDEAPMADAAFTRRRGRVCVVSVADCLPVLFAERRGRAVGAAHAGWRGLASGVLQRTVAAMRVGLGDRQAELLAFLGPAIGPAHFEVGAEVLTAMRGRLPQADRAFAATAGGKYFADLFALARQALAQADVFEVHGGRLCTYADPARFYSYRRDRVTGRHAALIWIEQRGDEPRPAAA
jgi:YfiH family protein